MNWLKKAWANTDVALVALRKAWDFLDGNKTKIGAAIAFVGEAISRLGKPEVGDTIRVTGEWIAAGGLAHVLIKLMDELPVKVGPPDAKPPVVREIKSSADVFKPGMVLKSGDGKTLTILRLVRGGGKNATGGVEFVYEADVKE